MSAVPAAKQTEVLSKVQEAIKAGLSDVALAEAVKHVSTRNSSPLGCARVVSGCPPCLPPERWDQLTD